MTTLSAERSGLSGRPGVGPGQADALATRARQTGAWTDPVLRDRIMQAFVAERALQMSTVRAFAHLGRAEPGAEGSIRKLTHAQLEATFGLLATEVEPGGAQGVRGARFPGHPGRRHRHGGGRRAGDFL
jgi:3-oxochol-4-en-24-oyl-CoA dehydrogenase